LHRGVILHHVPIHFGDATSLVQETFLSGAKGL
jgi:hypothetical protein